MELRELTPNLPEELDVASLLSMIEKPACTYSLDSRKRIKQNTSFEILFKSRHPLDVIGSFPEKIKQDISENQIHELKKYENVTVEGKRFSSIEVLPLNRDYILKFEVSKTFSADYKQIFEIVFDKSPAWNNACRQKPEVHCR